jgi:ABC-type uncharacterized transport system substrate-binding protein
VKRREFITLLGGAAAWPLAARAQQPIPVVGFLHTGSSATRVYLLAAFHQGLKATGYDEGRNVVIEYRWADDQNDRLPALADDLVHRRVTVISAINTPSAVAAKAATSAIPIIFLTGSDPVEAGFVASLNRPSGNLTGVSIFSTQLAAKRLELLLELVPNADVIAVLVNPANPTLSGSAVNDLQQSAARVFGRQLQVLHASTEGEIDIAFATLVRLRAGALLVGGEAFFNSRRDQLITLAARHAIPAIYSRPEFAAAGGLVSYGENLADAYRQAGVYVGRVLKGEKSTDLPVVQPTKFQLVLNLKTAKALGLEVPPTLLARADEVIE